MTRRRPRPLPQGWYLNFCRPDSTMVGSTDSKVTAKVEDHISGSVGGDSTRSDSCVIRVFGSKIVPSGEEDPSAETATSGRAGVDRSGASTLNPLIGSGAEEATSESLFSIASPTTYPIPSETLSTTLTTPFLFSLTSASRSLVAERPRCRRGHSDQAQWCISRCRRRPLLGWNQPQSSLSLCRSLLYVPLPFTEYQTR